MSLVQRIETASRTEISLDNPDFSIRMKGNDIAVMNRIKAAIIRASVRSALRVFLIKIIEWQFPQRARSPSNRSGRAQTSSQYGQATQSRLSCSTAMSRDGLDWTFVPKSSDFSFARFETNSFFGTRKYTHRASSVR